MGAGAVGASQPRPPPALAPRPPSRPLPDGMRSTAAEGGDRVAEMDDVAHIDDVLSVPDTAAFVPAAAVDAADVVAAREGRWIPFVAESSRNASKGTFGAEYTVTGVRGDVAWVGDGADVGGSGGAASKADASGTSDADASCSCVEDGDVEETPASVPGGPRDASDSTAAGASSGTATAGSASASA